MQATGAAGSMDKVLLERFSNLNLDENIIALAKSSLCLINDMTPKNSEGKAIKECEVEKRAILTDLCIKLTLALESEKADTPRKRELVGLLGDVYRQFGQTLYRDGSCPDNVEVCRQMLFAALNAQLYSLGIMDDCTVLTSNPTQCFTDFEALSIAKPFKFMDRIITEPLFAPNTFEIAMQRFSTPHEFFTLASTLRWLNGTCRRLQNEDKNKKITMQRHGNLLCLANELLKYKPDSETVKEKWELDYNEMAEYFEFMMKHDDKSNVESWTVRLSDLWEELEKTAEEKGKREGVARVLNKKAGTLGERIEEEEKKYRKAIAIRRELEDNQDFGLLALVLSNLSKTLMVQKKGGDFVELEEIISEAEQIVQKREDAGIKDTDHFFVHRNYILAMCLCALANEKEEVRQFYLYRAVMVMKLYPSEKHKELVPEHLPLLQKFESKLQKQNLTEIKG